MPPEGTPTPNPAQWPRDRARTAEGADPVVAPASEGTNATPGAVPPAPEAVHDPAIGGTAQPPAVAPQTAEEADAIEGITDIAEANKVIRQLRDENAKRRVQGKEYDEIFSKLGNAERAAALQLIDQLATDPAGAEARLEQMLERIRAHNEANAPARPAPVAEDDDDDDDIPQYLTPDDVERILQEREARRQEEEAINRFQTTAQSLGYELNTPDYGKLLAVASQHYGTDDDPITKAHEHIMAEVEAIKQAAIEEYRQSLSQQPRPQTRHVTGAAPEAPPMPVGGEGSPKTWDQARARAKARQAGTLAGMANEAVAI